MNVRRPALLVCAIADALLAGCNSRPDSASPALHAAAPAAGEEGFAVAHVQGVSRDRTGLEPMSEQGDGAIFGAGIRPSTGASGIQP